MGPLAKTAPLGIGWILLLICGVVQSAEAPAIVIVASGADGYGRPRLNNNDEIVWSQRSADDDTYTVWSNKRGQVSFNTFFRYDKYPDINDAGEVIWRFGDGGQGPDGIESNFRGLIYYERGGNIDPYYDSNRINNKGEIIWTRWVKSTGYRADEIWSNVRGRLTYSDGYTTNRQTAINDEGEVAYAKYKAYAPVSNMYDIYSTERGQITQDGSRDWYPDINNSGEIVWQRDFDFTGDDFQIWSTEKGQVTDNSKNNTLPSVNDNGEIVWQYWDGGDYEIVSSVRGQITDNDSDDRNPQINDRGSIAWVSPCYRGGDCAILAVFGNNVIDVSIDIKPGSGRNPINLKSRGNIPVAILTSETFDATQVNWETVRFGPSGATESHQRVHVKDADYDGDMDVVLHFKTRDTGILCGDTEASLTGETFSGEEFTGSDVIQIVKCP